LKEINDAVIKLLHVVISMLVLLQ